MMSSHSINRGQSHKTLWSFGKHHRLQLICPLMMNHWFRFPWPFAQLMSWKHKLPFVFRLSFAANFNYLVQCWVVSSLMTMVTWLTCSDILNSRFPAGIKPGISSLHPSNIHVCTCNTVFYDCHYKYVVCLSFVAPLPFVLYLMVCLLLRYLVIHPLIVMQSFPGRLACTVCQDFASK